MNKKNIVLITAISLWSFVLFYPVVEWSIECPDSRFDAVGNTNCIFVKSLLWEGVALLSLYLPGDGIHITDSVDEIYYKNAIPTTILLLASYLYYYKSGKKSLNKKEIDV